MQARLHIRTLNTIQDKHPYTHKLAYELCLGNHEFMERKLFELCFVLYIRFQLEKMSPQIIYQYFSLLRDIVQHNSTLGENTKIQEIIDLGLTLEQFSDSAHENFTLTNTMLKINYHVTTWQNTHHICKFCGHSLDLLTQELKALPKKKAQSRQK
ncbi:MAG: hypothetical protein A2V81_00385 [Candidatus Abawacabacteria bacterium RBG_16_42_10]|uniref:Uncharacterized protein n=1 Tax=Candidatus Abawacabacteria bacterium RBG_16_42_10 TaxID=1817814 RepID=A0A1F4XJA5_9BACT|nr:MAG: hypothetical protein A2V81_00385 [Candidatus Abawacabacteria bacterium RBG_16_42_10]